MSLSFLKQNFVIHDFFQNFNEKQQRKLSKYLCIIAIDYLSKYFKNRQMEFENIQELAVIVKSKLTKNKQKKPQQNNDYISEDLNEIKSQISKLKNICSSKKNIKSPSRENKSEKSAKKKELSIEELNYNTDSVEKNNRKSRDITPKITETKAPIIHSKSLGKPPLTKHHLDDNEIKASLIEISNNLFSSCTEKRKLDFSSAQNFSSTKNADKPKRSFFSKINTKKATKQKNSKFTDKTLKVPNYLKSVQSKIKPQIEFHKKLFKNSQRSPDFHLKEDVNFENNHIINEFITFGSSKNPSPISTLKAENNQNLQKIDENSNIVEIANSFLRSPFMQFVEISNKNEEISNIKINDSCNNEKSSAFAKKSPYNYNNSECVFNEITQRYMNCNKDVSSNFFKKDSSAFSNLIKIEQNSDGESISSTFSLLPNNEEILGFFRKEFNYNASKESKNNTESFDKENIPWEKTNKRDRESDIGKIVSVSSRRERESKENFFN